MSVGWQARNFHYVKNLKPLEEYLRPPLSPEQKRDQGARDVRAMFERLMAAQPMTEN